MNEETYAIGSGVNIPDRDNERTGYEGNLTTQQQQMLNELVQYINNTEYKNDFEQNPDGIRFVLRFLRATMKSKTKDRVFDLEPAKKRLISCYNFRREYKVDEIRANIENNQLPEEYVHYREEVRPRITFIEEKTGRVVQIERFGALMSNAKVDLFPLEIWVKYFIYDIEAKLLMLRNESKKRGYEVSMQIAIMDQAGVHWGSLKRISLFKALSSLASEHYPELLGPIFVCNVSWFFSKSFAIVKPFLDPLTVSKLYVSDKVPLDKISNFMSLNMIPKEYGGLSDLILKIPLHARPTTT